MRRARTKRPAIQIETYDDWDVSSTTGPLPSSQPPPSTLHNHTDYTFGPTGISTSRSVYRVDISRHPELEPIAPETRDVPDSNAFDPTQGSDADYVTLLPRRRTAGDAPLLAWLPHRDKYIEEFLRLEAPNINNICPRCSASVEPPNQYRCSQCFGDRLFCKTCIVEQHATNPLHQVENWNSMFFERCTLQSLGLRLQLGHPVDDECTNPVRAFGNSFIVITSHGVIPVTLDFCGCMGHAAHDVQLLRARLFPATSTDPRTAATFEVLRLFQLLSFGSKVSAYEFYQTLSRLTNNFGDPVPDRYSAFLRMVREWRHVRLMKRFGRGHDSSGVAGTSKGECAVLCPACPHPGKNLPPDWERHGESKKWIHTLFVAIDANFRLKRLSASNDARDPSLNRGSSYFVEEGDYKEFLDQADDETSQEVSTCNNYDAVKSASIRGGKGTTASGVGTIECSRHDMKRPVSVGDLQKGEKYRNMDYLYFSSIKNHSPKTVVVSYDIACQWSTNLTRRSATYPPELVSSANELSVTLLHSVMLKKVQEAVKMRGDHVGDFLALSASLPAASVQTFSKLIQDWEGGLSQENPYEVTVEAVSANKVRLQMAQEEEAAIAADDTPPVHDTISPRIFVEQGLELLDQRDRLQDDTRRLGIHSTEIQQTRVSERRTRLLRRIAVWNAIQELYLPGVTLHKQTRSTENPSESELSVLLPSDLLPGFRVDDKLVNYEWRLRFSQAHDILADLRRQVLILSTMYQSKDRLIRGQSHNTRSATLIHNVQLRINSLAAKYRGYREALCILGDALNKSGWQTTLQLLADSDLRSLKGGEDASSSEGRRTLSWIWMTQRTDESEMTDTMSEALRIEW
ncbi:CxC2-like cysteine cluster KDZ transposase-associated domain-containing protein, partial [Pleurotus pulmonarius]